MISKVTIFSLLLALLLGVGIERWNLGHRDDCTRYFAGARDASPSIVVTTGTRKVIMPCDIWLPRQPEKIQILCLLDYLLAMVFLLNAAADIRSALQDRRRRSA